MKLFILVCCFLLSCSAFRTTYVSKKDIFFQEFIKELKAKKKTTGVNNSGFYYTIYKDNITKYGSLASHFSSPKIFLSNGLIYNFETWLNTDTTYYFDLVKKGNLEGAYWGVYHIENNIIKAIIPTHFYKRGLVSSRSLKTQELSKPI